MRIFLLLLLCLMTVPVARAGDDCPGCADLYGFWSAGSRNEWGKELVILEDRHLFQINGDIIRENRMKLIQHNGGTADFAEKNHRFIYELIDPYEQGRKTFKYWTVFDKNDSMSLWSYYCETEEAARAYYRNFDFENRKLEEGCIHGLYADGPGTYTMPEKIDKYYIPTPEELCPASIYGVWRKLGLNSEIPLYIHLLGDKRVTSFNDGSFYVSEHEFIETQYDGRIFTFENLDFVEGLGKNALRKKSNSVWIKTIKKNYRYILGAPQCDIEIISCNKEAIENWKAGEHCIDTSYYRWPLVYDQPFFKKKPKPAPIK